MSDKFAERVIERGPMGQIIRSELVPIDDADESCRNVCGHIGVIHEDLWLYTAVICAVCKKPLGCS